MLNITICDDEHSQIEYLSTFVREWADERGVAVRISDYESAESFLFAYGDDKTTDVLLLDIQMKKIDGIALARKIRQDNNTVQIVFITGYTEYISEGYEVEALHYLIKPVSKQKLYNVLDRAAEKLKRNERGLILETADGVVRIPLHEIRFIEVRHNYITIHSKNDITVKMTLSEIEKELDDRFFRTNRSFIVNLSYLHKTTKTDVVLTDGTNVPLSKRLYEAVNRAFINQR